MTKITLSYVQIRAALPVLKRMQNLSMRATVSLIVARLGRILNRHAMDSEEVRVGLMRKYADEDDQGEPIQVPVLDGDGKPVGNQMMFQIPDPGPLNIEWTEALQEKIVVEITLLPLKELDSSDLELTPEEMMALEPLLKE